MAKSKKVNKWEAAPESIRKLKEAINGTVDGLSMAGELTDAEEWEQDLIDILGKVLDDYNELEAKHNADCGLISKLEEENKKYETLAAGLHNDADYQRPGIDMHGLKNFGVHVDCEENRKAFNELKEALDKHKSQIEKLETKHAKATRFIARLTEALNEDRMAKKHYEEQSFRLRNTVRNYGEQIRCFKNDISELRAKIYKLEEDKGCSEFRNDSLLKALNQAGIRPSFDIRANKWLIQYTDKAENAFLAADQIKRDAEKKIDKLVSALDKCHMNVKWDGKNDKWRVYVRPSDTEIIGVSFDLCEFVEAHEKLVEENKTLISERDDLKSKSRSWQVSYNAVEKKAKEATAVIDSLNDYAEALKGRIQELEDRSKDIYNLATIGWINNSMYGYEEIRKMLSFDPRE